MRASGPFPRRLHDVLSAHPWVAQGATEAFLLFLVWSWRFHAEGGAGFWPLGPAILLIWLVQRLYTLRRQTAGSMLQSAFAWIESHATGLLIACAIACLFLGFRLGWIPLLAAWSLAALFAVELVWNVRARLEVGRWALKRWRLVWPRGGEMLAVLLAFWIWQRLVGAEATPFVVFSWLGGASLAILWATRDIPHRWAGLIAPGAVLPPLLWAFFDYPTAVPAYTVIPLVGLMFGLPMLHRMLDRGPGTRSASLAWYWMMGLAGLWLVEPLLTAASVGAGDAQWYALVLADAIAQFKAGIFPPIVGQSEFAFNGSVFPGSFAPYYQVVGVLGFAATGGGFSPYAIQHLLAAASIIGGIFTAYVVLRRQSRAQRPFCAAIALLYGSCPAWLGAIYSMDMYMTILTMPWLPLVFHGCIRAFLRLDIRSALTVAAPLSLTWLAHPSIGLWTTFAAAGTQVVRLFFRRRSWMAELRWVLSSGGSFLVLTCMPFTAVLFTERATNAFRHEYVIETMARHWSAAWFPVSNGANLISDQQLGWAMAAIGLAGGWFLLRRRQGFSAALVPAGMGIVALLAPVPAVQDALWRWLPGFVKDITDNWPTQRLLPLLSAIVLVGCAVPLLRALRRRQTAQRVAGLGLAACLCWSFAEASKFIERGHATIASLEISAKRLLPENIVLTRNAQYMFSRTPDYDLDTFVSPTMSLALLDLDSKEPIDSNLAASGRGLSSESIKLGLRKAATGSAEFENGLMLRPGRKYVVEFEFGTGVEPGVLFVRGDRTERQYRVGRSPGSASLGFTETGTGIITLRNTGNAIERVRLSFWTDDPAATIPNKFATLGVGEIDMQGIPVRIDSHTPYRAAVNSPRDAWVETPRMSVPGYAARVNGAPAETTVSSSGLVLVRVPGGVSNVDLVYRPPGPVWAAFIVSSIAWAVLAGVFAWRWFRCNPFRGNTATQAEPRWQPARLLQRTG